MYLSFEEYGEMGGTLDSAAFNIANRKANAEIKRQTHNRLEALSVIPEEVKACAFELVQLYTSEAANISSISNDGVSITYQAVDLKADATSTIRGFLDSLEIDGVPVLYCGVD